MTDRLDLREWKTVVNGITFFCWIDGKGRKHCTACSESQEKLTGAATLMKADGWAATVVEEGDVFTLVGALPNRVIMRPGRRKKKVKA